MYVDQLSRHPELIACPADAAFHHSFPTISLAPTSRRSSFRPLNRNADVRATTCRLGTSVSRLINSSVKPSLILLLRIGTHVQERQHRNAGPLGRRPRRGCRQGRLSFPRFRRIAPLGMLMTIGSCAPEVASYSINFEATWRPGRAQWDRFGGRNPSRGQRPLTK